MFWGAVPASACRRRQASSGVSPGRMNLVPCGTGSLAPPDLGPGCGVVVAAIDACESATRAAGATGAKTGPAATGFVGVEMAPIRDPVTGFCRRERLAGLRPNSRSSQRRRVSRPISMPTSRRPAASVSTDSPACRSRSNSSRWDASRTVAWLRGNRDCSTAWAKVVGRGGVGEAYVGSDMVVVGERYVWCLGSARGAPQAQSKRKRLDVGVLPYCFVLFLLGESAYYLNSFIGWFMGLVDFLDFVIGVLVELVSLSFWLSRFSVHFSGRVLLGFVGRRLVAGGGGC